MLSLFRFVRQFLPLAIALMVDSIIRHEANRLQITHLDLTLENLPPAFDGFKIVQISDIHIGMNAWIDMPRMRHYANHVMGMKPDVILNTGDFDLLDMSPVTQRKMVDMLKLYCAPEGVFGVIGNHDYDADVDKVRETVRQGGVVLLENEHHVFKRGKQQLYLAGVELVRYGDPDLAAALEGIPQDACVILMVHEPDFADLVVGEPRVKLQLSGHTHGGQLILPLIGPPYLPLSGRKYVRGLYQLEGFVVYVNSGLGMAYPPLRRKALAEITEITLRCKS